MKKLLEKYSAFQIVAVILIVLLFIAIIVEVGIIINLKTKTDDKKRDNDEITTQISDTSQTEDFTHIFYDLNF